MKLIHLSDLHIGKRVNEISMIEEQTYILGEILRVIDEEAADAVLIAGDVYDKTVPSTEAVTLFDAFLFSLSRRKIPTLIISGNHDSAERLSFGSRLMAPGGIHISHAYGGKTDPIILEDGHGPVYFWLLPFIKPIHVKRFFPEDAIESYTDACAAAVKRMELDGNARNVLITHQFVTGAATSESEEISVGGSDNVDASVFAGFDYVALGHIHGPQNIGTNKVRYCGTPLKYSFSEEHHCKSVTVVHLGAKGELQLSLRPLFPRHDMRSIRGSFSEVTDRAFYSAPGAEDYLHVILTDEEDIPEAVGKLRQIYPNMMKLSYDNTRTRTDSTVTEAADIRHKTPLALFEELYELQNNKPMSDVQRSFAAELIESIREGNA